MEISFATDMSGFLSQECPSCEQIFKVRFGDGSQEVISYCPYCGHEGQQCWFTPEQVNYMQMVATSIVVGPEIKKFQRQLESSSKGMFKRSHKKNLPKPGPPPIETEDSFSSIHFSCCNETIKVKDHSHHFCIICGKEIDMIENNLKKIFLSHKGVDKSEVRDYQETLKLLGYEPWIDEDAMPAGTSLERGLLQGMKDSCGVVFFITPSFRDEGYLETEVNYAIQQKREKGDRFSIIALQLVGNDGSVGEIPELLTSYVWKKPGSPLEALREIVRALPIESKLVDWRDTIDGVVTDPIINSTLTKISAEAKTILEEAAAGDGRIMKTRTMDGNSISANRKSLIPNSESRTVAIWIGGLEDLIRRGYVKDLGHKGEVFRVTREGYEALD